MSAILLSMMLAMTIQTATAINVTEIYEARELSYTGGVYKDHAFKYRLMKPETLEPGKKYPLVVFLHGAGERGDDNVKSMLYLPTWLAEPPMRKQFPCFVLVPQCPNEQMWIDKHWSLEKHSMSPEPTDELKAVVAMMHETLKGEAVDANRVYLTGLSMGGYGAWDLATRHPEWFAALVPVCGGGDESQASKLVNLPVWAWHGGMDQAVPVERSRKMIAAIKAAGGNPRYTELAYVNHNSWTPAYHTPDLFTWMFQQRRAPQK